ncbi:MAG: trypsin-like peptidase domain-containing protein [Bacillota bacterium]|nr:trypsin-like peptidase domain-containing protein [Bacillota bacterium]
MQEFDSKRFSQPSVTDPRPNDGQQDRRGANPYSDVLNTLYEKIDRIAERKLNEVVVREVNRGLASTVQAYKRQQSKRLLATVLWLGITAILIVVAFGLGVKYASTDDHIRANYEKLSSQTWNSEIRSAVHRYINENGVENVMPQTVVAGDSIPEIYQKVLPSVAGIHVDGFSVERFGPVGAFTSNGSGVVLQETEDAILVVTNYHVIEDYRSIYVDFNTKTRAKATVLGTDSEKDIAMLSVRKSDLTADQIDYIRPIEIADSGDIRVGERAIAIGNPIGYSNTVTAGIISAVDRFVEGAGSVKYIQTDAAINPGNSGGALVNAAGQLIGINTAKIKDVEVEGIGFSIPSSLLRQIFPQLVEKGYSTKAFIGIRGTDFNSEELAAIRVVDLIPGAAAEQYGIKIGDYLVSIDDEPVTTMQQLSATLSGKNAGEPIKIGLYRNGTFMELNLVLGEQRVN